MAICCSDSGTTGTPRWCGDSKKREAEKKARGLFKKSLSRQYGDYLKTGQCWVESKKFAVSYRIMRDGVVVYKTNHRIVLGEVCVHPRAEYEMPDADNIMQLCLLLIYDEEMIMRRGNWCGSGSEKNKAWAALEDMSSPIILRREK